jgi:plasmid stabilization system protein ParE
MPFRVSTLAEQDLEEIWSYVAEDASPATADRLIDAIIDRFELLAEHPRMGRLRPEFGPGVRSFTVENYQPVAGRPFSQSSPPHRFGSPLRDNWQIPATQAVTTCCVASRGNSQSTRLHYIVRATSCGRRQPRRTSAALCCRVTGTIARFQGQSLGQSLSDKSLLAVYLQGR